MAYVRLNNKWVRPNPGHYKGKFIEFQKKGRKVTAKGYEYIYGYLIFRLEDGTIVSQWIMLNLWKSGLFYKLIKAIEGEVNLNIDLENFQFRKLINKDIVIEIDYTIDYITTYPNVANILSVEEGIKKILEEKAEDEEKERELLNNGFVNMSYIEKVADKIKCSDNNSYNLKDEYDEIIGF